MFKNIFNNLNYNINMYLYFFEFYLVLKYRSIS